MNFAYGWAFSKPVRKVFYNLTITGLSVAVALVIGTIELVGLLAQKLNAQGVVLGVVGEHQHQHARLHHRRHVRRHLGDRAGDLALRPDRGALDGRPRAAQGTRAVVTSRARGARACRSASIDDAIEALRARGLRLSTTRQLVLEALFAAAGPVSAEALALRLALVATSVYRNLETLERHGLRAPRPPRTRPGAVRARRSRRARVHLLPRLPAPREPSAPSCSTRSASTSGDASATRSASPTSRSSARARRAQGGARRAADGSWGHLTWLRSGNSVLDRAREEPPGWRRRVPIVRVVDSFTRARRVAAYPVLMQNVHDAGRSRARLRYALVGPRSTDADPVGRLLNDANRRRRRRGCSPAARSDDPSSRRASFWPSKRSL